MAHWLVKSEPSTWSWEDQVKAGTTNWSGVRNHQAAKNMKAMKKGDQVFFYHSGEGREIIGIIEIVKEYYPDPTDETGTFGMVDVKAVKKLPQPVTLKQIKKTKALQNMALVRQSRLSVMPVTEAEWKVIISLAA
jgi:predicted RNA-binding protein with PUA-like domain